jgi:3-phosphoshikimate 1-carboxyvinyltransferase
MENKLLTSYKISNSLNGTITVPGDKSISHRALIFGACALGKTKIFGLLESEDVINTKKSLEILGAKVSYNNDYYEISGLGIGGLQASNQILDQGNSGTGVRLLMGLLASYPFKTTFTGDASLKKRPMKRVFSPLEKMGAKFECQEGGLLPASVTGYDIMMPIDYELPVASAQVKSAILLAAMNIEGTTTVIEPEKTRDHTELLMKYLGLDIKTSEENGKNIIKLSGKKQYNAKDIIIPSDPSSAAFAIVAALIVPNSEIVVKNVLINPLRTGLFDSLIEMGANIQYLNIRKQAGEKIADIKACYSRLKGITIPAERAPSMIDEYPILSIAAACAEGKTLCLGLEELKVKESNRLEAIHNGLKNCGIKSEIGNDSLTIYSSSIAGGNIIKTHGDHRIAMSFLVAGLVAENPIIVDEPEMINTSFPNFSSLMNNVGAQIK